MLKTQTSSPRRTCTKQCFTLYRLKIFLALLVLSGVSFSIYFTIQSTSSESIISGGGVLNQGLVEFKEGKPRTTANTKKKKPVQYYVVFSTGCSPQQHWESYVFFYHAFKVQQPGNITRLVSGCSKQNERYLRTFHEEKIRTMSEGFHVYFTPDYGSAGFEENYKYNNKPNSLYDWMADVLHMNETNAHSKNVQDRIVILMDPDMILLRPLLHDFSDQNVIYARKNPPTKVVQHGMPMAQQDAYLANEWQHFNVSYITQGGSFPTFKPQDGSLYYNSGPPYLATVRDMWKMVKLWKEYVPRVYKEYPKLFAEMYGLIIAKTQLNLPHTLVKSIVASTTTTDVREGWQFVDALPDDLVCDVNSWKTADLPIVLHYCKRYLLGKWFFSKYRLKKNFISCDMPLLTPPPKDTATLGYDYWVRPPPDQGSSHEMEIRNITKKQAKREAFMLCGLISAVNEAARYYKLQHCASGANLTESYNFHDNPHS
jgi:hypothetical protein